MKERLERLETAMLLSGENAARSAIMTIHPGAGGTESQDWAEMLLRMYLRWAEREGFQIVVTDRLEGEGRVAFRYCSAAGDLTEEDNVNGSARCIAGVFNETRTVLGLMPHPENSTDPLLGCIDGQGLFNGIVSALQ